MESKVGRFKKFAWYPVELSDGRSLWMEHYYKVVSIYKANDYNPRDKLTSFNTLQEK